jgi:hypothetical protein
MKQPTESIDGVGPVYAGQELIGNFSYHITVFQDMPDADNPAPGSKSARGKIDAGFHTVLRLMGDQNILTLHLEDGRKCEFFFTSNDGTITTVGEIA